MADANVEVDVSIEAALHKTLTDALNEIQLKHGVRVDSMRVEWIDITRVGDARPVCQVRTLRLETVTGELERSMFAARM